MGKIYFKFRTYFTVQATTSSYIQTELASHINTVTYPEIIRDCRRYFIVGLLVRHLNYKDIGVGSKQQTAQKRSKDPTSE